MLRLLHIENIAVRRIDVVNPFLFHCLSQSSFQSSRQSRGQLPDVGWFR